jgi:hypothetical protein
VAAGLIASKLGSYRDRVMIVPTLCVGMPPVIPVGAELARDGGAKDNTPQKPYRYSLTVFKFQFLYL